MKQGAEALQSEPYFSEDTEAEKKKGADILPFRQKPEENNKEEIGQSYEAYKSLGGRLSPEEYRDVLRRAADKKEALAASRWSASAHSMAEAGGITLLPETVVLYGILRNPEKEQYSVLGDQKLLAEALRLAGDGGALKIFINNFEKINPNLFK